MRFTSEDLMKSMGLQVGDKVKYTFISLDGSKMLNEEYIVEIVKDNSGRIWIQNNDGYKLAITNLMSVDYEILPRPKRVGDLKCGFKKELSGIGSCTTCPVRIICGHYTCKDELGAGDTLYEYLETYKKKIKEEYDYEDEDYNDFDQEIYDLLKARLDKEVE